MTIGYVGLGSMGGALARRLQLTHSLMVHDMSVASVQDLVAKGATAAVSPGDVAARCEVIFLCLPTSDHVRAVIFGDNGIAASAKPGLLIVDQTSGDPNATRAMAKQLASRGIGLIDAPVSGGPQGAEAGTIAIMVGATPDQFARIAPILRAISPNIFHAGGTGNGHVIKLVNNLISGAQRLLTLEGLALAVKNGVDTATAVEILRAGGAKNAYLQRGDRIVQGDLSTPFTLGLMHKDVRLACQLGIESDVPLLFGNLTRELYQMCINENGREAKVDTSALVIERTAGTHIVPRTYRVD